MSRHAQSLVCIVSMQGNASCDGSAASMVDQPEGTEGCGDTRSTAAARTGGDWITQLQTYPNAEWLVWLNKATRHQYLPADCILLQICSKMLICGSLHGHGAGTRCRISAPVEQAAATVTGLCAAAGTHLQCRQQALLCGHQDDELQGTGERQWNGIVQRSKTERRGGLLQ